MHIKWFFYSCPDHIFFSIHMLLLYLYLIQCLILSNPLFLFCVHTFQIFLYITQIYIYPQQEQYHKFLRHFQIHTALFLFHDTRKSFLPGFVNFHPEHLRTWSLLFPGFPNFLHQKSSLAPLPLQYFSLKNYFVYQKVNNVHSYLLSPTLYL